MSNVLGIKKGERVRLVYMPDDPDPIPVGTEGTVALVSEIPFTERGQQQTQFIIRWDNGRSLSCVCPPDILERVAVEETANQ
jgi:hypothetical protein